MTEKAKLTQEQAAAIEKLEIERSSVVFYHANSIWTGEFECLNDVTLDDFIKASYVGYEVDWDFKVGDLVLVSESPFTKPYEIHEIESLNATHAELKGFISIFPLSSLRHATPEDVAKEKERCKWAAVGREVGEFKDNDIVYNKGAEEGLYIVYSDIYSADAFGSKLVQVIENGRILSFHAKDLNIVCFAEDRRDIERGDE